MAARAAHLHPELAVRRPIPEPPGLVDDDRLDPRDEVHDGAGHGGDVGDGRLPCRPRSLGAHALSFVSTRVACAAWNPPWPETTHTSAPSTCEVDSPRICRTPSATWFHPVRSSSESMPP